MGILTNYGLAIIIGLILLYLAADFLWKFVRGAIGLGRDLDRAINAVAEIQTSQKGGITDLQKIANEVMTTDRLGHLWGEYIKTLHPQREPDLVCPIFCAVG